MKKINVKKIEQFSECISHILLIISQLSSNLVRKVVYTEVI